MIKECKDCESFFLSSIVFFYLVGGVWEVSHSVVRPLTGTGHWKEHMESRIIG